MRLRDLILMAAICWVVGGCNQSAPPLPEPGVRPGGGRGEIDPYAALDAVDPRERVAGVALVAHTADARAGARLRPLLADPEGEVRAAAVDALIEHGDASDARRMRSLLEDLDPRVRQAAIRWLVVREGGAATEDLRPLAHEDASADVRAVAVLGLASTDDSAGDLEWVVGLHQGAEGELEPSLRRAVVEYLCVHGRRDPAHALERLAPLLDDGDPAVRAAAARGLGASGEATSSGAARAALVRAWERERDPTAAAAVLLAHAACGGQELAAECRRDPRVREVCAASLATLGETEMLAQASRRGDPVARRAGLLAYPREDAGAAIALARERIADEDPGVAWAAVMVRAQLGDDEALPQLIEGLRLGFERATDALRILLELTGGDPNHGFDHDAWLLWSQARRDSLLTRR
jgi:HEAT repeat protein